MLAQLLGQCRSHVKQTSRSAVVRGHRLVAAPRASPHQVLGIGVRCQGIGVGCQVSGNRCQVSGENCHRIQVT